MAQTFICGNKKIANFSPIPNAPPTQQHPEFTFKL